jgi:hypothetical protein
VTALATPLGDAEIEASRSRNIPKFGEKPVAFVQVAAPGNFGQNCPNVKVASEGAVSSPENPSICNIISIEGFA